jgi:predicted permease
VLVLPRIKSAEPQTANSEGQEETKASTTLRIIFIVVAAAMLALFGWSLVAPIQNWNNPNEDGFSYLNAFWATIVCLPVALYLVRGAIAGHGRRAALARKALIIGCGMILIVVAFLIFQQIANAAG